MDPHPNIPQQNPAITKKQLSNIMSLDPDERSATDVEQIYQVETVFIRSGEFKYSSRYSTTKFSARDNLV